MALNSDLKALSCSREARKGRRQQPPTSQPPQAVDDGIGLMSAEEPASLIAPSPIPSDQNLNAFLQTESHYQVSGIDFGGPIDPAWSPWPSNDMSVRDSSLSSFDLESYNITPATPRSQSSLQHSVSPGSSGGILVPAGSLPVLHGDSEMSNDGTSDDHNCHSSHPWTLNGTTEDGLFMHYLDQVFYVQIPFYHFQSRQGRGWLFSILRKVKSAYHAALALSQRHLLSTRPPDNDTITGLVQLRTRDSHYDIAIQQTERAVNEPFASNERARLSHSLGILTTLLQLLFCELFNGGRDTWQTHLRTSRAFIPALLQARMPLAICDGSPHCTNDHPHEGDLHPEGDYAINVLLGSFVTFDILASVSTRSTPILNINHLQVLETPGISLESLIGCRNPIIAIIFQITLLDKWKKDTQRANKLSIIDLANRADLLHERLRQGFVRSAGPPIRNPLGHVHTPIQQDISKVFSLAAFTYLHVVVSGACPELTEIAESVSETIIAFKNLKDPKLIRRLVWPLCITGCLALEHQYDFFRDLIARAEITQWSTGTCYEAFRIMEECWKVRRTSPEPCDWTTIMKRRGYYVLLG